MQINITNGTLTQVGETLSPASGYSLPLAITVTGATSSYDSATGEITLTSPTSAMGISASAVVIPSISIGSLSLSKAYVGSDEIGKIYYGSTLLYEAAPSGYVMGFRGMSTSGPSLTRAGDTSSATWSATSGVISFDGIDVSKIFGGYVGNDGEELTWDSTNLVYKNGSTTYTGNVFVKINRFFCKAYYVEGVLDGYDLYFGNSAPDATYQDWFLGKDHCVIGCYKAKGGSGAYANGLQSKQGLTNVGNAYANVIVTAYKKNSSTAYSLHEKWYNENAILQVLFMALFATRQTDHVFPQATYRNCNGDSRATGYMDSYRAQSLFAYEPTGNSGERGNMFLGIEDFCGWGFELVCGVSLLMKNVHTSLDYANFSYSGSYSDSGLDRPSDNSFIKELQQSDTIPGLLIPKTATDASDNTYFCDYNYYLDYSGGMPWYQGASNPNSSYGVFCFMGYYSASDSYKSCAGRLCGTPL